jgi:hypothetical protein
LKIRNAILALAKVLSENDRIDIITDICWALSYITDENRDAFHTIAQSSAMSRLV